MTLLSFFIENFLFSFLVFLSFIFYYIFSSFTFQMLPPKTPIHSLLPCSITHPLPLPGPAFPLTGAYDLTKTKGLSSQWWLPRLSSATYATRDTALGGTGSSYGVAEPFSSLGTFSSSFIRGPVFHPLGIKKILYLAQHQSKTTHIHWSAENMPNRVC